jgi:hypothetical protein
VLDSGALTLRRPLLLYAPTSSGKTLLAEIALWRSVCQGNRTLFLVPTRALAEEVYATVRGRWEKAGRTILLATRDRPAADPMVRAGHFDLLVTIPEKARTFLASDPAFLRGVGAIVVDEVQAIGEPGRGATFDLLITTIRRLAPACRIVAVTTPGPHVEAIRSWLGAALLETRERPRDLWEGVIDAESGTFRGRDASGREIEAAHLDLIGEVPLPTDPRLYCRAASIEVARRCIQRGGQRVLIFVPTRETAHDWAIGLAEALREAAEGGDQSCVGAPPSLALELLRATGGGSLGRLLRPAFQAGVGVHHGELPAELRSAIEQDFRRGALRAIVATSTLSRGVNLHADTVISVPIRIGGGGRGTRPRPETIDRRRLVDQGGRAGRFAPPPPGHPEGAPLPPGLSLVVASGAGMSERLWIELFGDEQEESVPAPLAQESAATLVLHAAVLGGARDRDELRAFLAASHAAKLPLPRPPASFSALGAAPPAAAFPSLMLSEGLLTAGIDEAAAAGLLMHAGQGRVAPTALGEAVVGCGLQLSTATMLLEWMRALGTAECDPLELLFVLAATPDGCDHPIRLGALERERLPPLHQLRAALGFESPPPPWLDAPDPEMAFGCEPMDGVAGGAAGAAGGGPNISVWLGERWARIGGFGRSEQEAAKKALAAAAWIGPGSTADLEASYGMFAGSFQALGRHLGWLAESAARLAEALTLHPTLGESCASLGRRLPVGLPPGAEDLQALARAAVDRDQLHRLAAEGFATLEDVASGDADALGFVLGREGATRALAIAREELRWRARAALLAPGAADRAPASWVARPHPQPHRGIAPGAAGSPDAAPAAPPTALAQSAPAFLAADRDRRDEEVLGNHLAPDGMRSEEDGVGTSPDSPSPSGGMADAIHSGEAPPAASASLEREADVWPGDRPGGDGRDVIATLHFDPKQPQIVGVGGRRVRLTGHQGRLLAALARDVGHCVTYATLLDRVWKGASVEQQQIAQHKRRLVQRLERAGLAGDVIETVYGVGLSLFPTSPDRLVVASPLPHLRTAAGS